MAMAMALHSKYIPIGSMYAIYANIGGILMGSMLPYIAYMDPMGLIQNNALLQNHSKLE